MCPRGRVEVSSALLVFVFAFAHVSRAKALSRTPDAFTPFETEHARREARCRKRSKQCNKTESVDSHDDVAMYGGELVGGTTVLPFWGC
jgi:hypothetical protein